MARSLEAQLDRSRYLDAYSSVGGRDGLCAAAGPEHGALLARLAYHLGSQSLCTALARRLYYAHPEHPAARGRYVAELQRRRGGLQAIDWLRQRGVTATSARHPEDLIACARAYSALRDATRAEALLRRARAEAPEDPYAEALLAHLLLETDRVPEACDAYAALHAQHPHYAAIAHGYVDALHRAGAHALGLDVLRRYSEETQSGRAQLWLAQRALDMGDYALASRCAEQGERRLPLLGKPESRWLLAMRYRVCYNLGERAEAMQHLHAWDTPRARELAERLAEAPLVPGDVRLDVPHVRQGHVTCAPASLTAICRYWGDPVEHDDVVTAICFGGTPAVRQRRWAAERELEVRGFDLSVAAGRALIDRGFPFTLVTNASDSSHLQVVKGYDPVREAWLVMDPSADGEVLHEWSSLERDELFMGPECAVYVPRTRAEEVAELTLPAEDLHRSYFVFTDALDAGDLDSARRALELLRASAPDAGLTCRAEAAWAHTLSDWDEELRATRRWLARFPDNPRLQASVAELERTVGVPLNTRLAHVAAWADSWDPRLLAELARTLMASPSRWPDAARLLRRANLAAPRNAYPLGCMAELAALAQDWQWALDTSRWALCLDEAYDFAASTHFLAASRLRRREEALAFLEAHASVVGERGSRPLIWLARSYADAGKPRAALEVLRARSLEDRRGDGPLHLELVRLALSLGETTTAREALERARGTSSVISVAPREAQLATHEGDLATALTVLDAALNEAPWATELIQEYARTLARAQGWMAAKDWLRARALARPDLMGLVVAACEWSRADPVQEAEVVEAALRRRPGDPWLLRELALIHSTLGRPAEAEALLDEVLSLDAQDAVAHRLRGEVLSDRHRTQEALEAFQAALAFDPTDRQCIDGIARLDLSLDDRRVALDAFVAKLEEGTPHDDDVYGALPIGRLLPPDDAIALGSRLVGSFPDSIAAHDCAISLALHSAREAHAQDFLEAALARFPDDRRLWQRERELALRNHDRPRALELSRSLATRYPLDSVVLLDLVQDLREADRLAEATEVVESWLARAGESAAVRRALGSLRMDTDGPNAALDALMPLLVQGYCDESLWRDAAWYGKLAQRTEALLTTLRELEAARPDDPLLPWYRSFVSEGEARRMALERARELAPESVRVVEALAHYWSDRGEFAQALDYCPPADWQGELPVILRGRRAAIIRQRGDINAAIDEMLRILAHDPSYAWGIERLLEWTAEARRPDDRLHAARLRRRLFPADPKSFANLADVLIRGKQLEEAFEVLSESLARHPTDAYTISTLVRLLVREGHLDQAQGVVDGLSSDVPAGVRLEAELWTTMARGDLRTALGQLRRVSHVQPLAALEVADAAPIAEALFFRLDDREPVRRLAIEVLARDDLGHQADFWCEFGVAVARLDPTLTRTLVSRTDRLSRVGLRSLGRALQCLPGATAEGFRAELVAGRARFPYEAELWGGVSYILTGLERHDEVFRWTEGYESRPGLAPWMLWHRVNAALVTDRLFAARDTARFALTLPHDGNRRYFELTAALLDELSGVDGVCTESGAGEAPEPLLRDALRLLQTARREWSSDAATHAHMTEGAWDSLLLDHAGRLPHFDETVLELVRRALVADHARLAGRLARAMYSRRLRKRLRASQRSVSGG